MSSRWRRKALLGSAEDNRARSSIEGLRKLTTLGPSSGTIASAIEQTGGPMRRTTLTTAALILAVAGTSFAQGFVQYTSRADSFAVSFPGEPNVRDTPWMSEQGITLPAHVYSVENERG